MPNGPPPPTAVPAGALPRRAWLLALAFLGVLLAGLLLHLGLRPLENEEPRRALVALEMALRGDLVVPTTNGNLYVNKPPLFSWLLLGVMRLTGSTAEGWIRAPTVVSFLLLGWLVWAVARRELGPRQGLLSAGLLLTFTTLLFYGTLHADIDLFYTLLVALQGLAIYLCERRGRPWALFALSYLALALGFLTKGMPSLAFQGLTLLGWLAWERRWRWLFSWAHAAGAALFLLLVGGYFALYARHGADPLSFLARLLVESSERTLAEGRGGVGGLLLHLVRFPLDLLALALPWSLLAGHLLFPGFRAQLRQRPFLRFCALFVLVNAVPYWLSPGTRPRYLFPLLPFLAPLLAAGALAAVPDGYARSVRAVAGGALTLCALASFGLPFLPDVRPHVELPAFWLVPVVLLALSAGYWRARTWPAALAVLVLAVACGRVGYDLVVPALRRAHTEDLHYQRVAEVLNRDYRGQPLQLTGQVYDPERKALPFTGRVYTYPLHEWFTTSLSYYITVGRGALLPYGDRPEPGPLYLAHESFDPGRPYEVLRRFPHPLKRQGDLKLIRLLPAPGAAGAPAPAGAPP